MIAGSTSEFIFAQICAGLPSFALAISASISSTKPAPQIDRRDRDLLEAGRGCVAGHEIEQARGVPAQRRVAGEERQVGVNLGRVRVIIAGPEMDIGAKLTAFAAHHQRNLGVRLQLHEAVDDLHARRARARAPSGCSPPRRSAPSARSSR